MSLVSLLTAGLVAGTAIPAPAADTACVVQNPQRMPAEGRPSPLDSLTFAVGRQKVKVCYGRPSLRGRTMIGGSAVPYGKLWRTGANEPTIFYTPVKLDVAGIAVHIASRVEGLAEPGEVATTGTVADLVVGSGLRFRDVGARELKGVPGEWPIRVVIGDAGG